MNRPFGIIHVLIALSLLACRSGPPRPVDIVSEDMCSRCRMAISEMRFAAEFIDLEGETRKFDDLRCLVGFLKAIPNPKPVLATYVMDFSARRWIKAEDAHFVQSAVVRTPMGGGVAAFQNRPAAEEFARQTQGRLLTFSEVQQVFQSPSP